MLQSCEHMENKYHLTITVYVYGKKELEKDWLN